jgi:hypothetical protein
VEWLWPAAVVWSENPKQQICGRQVVLRGTGADRLVVAMKAL